MNVKNLVQHNLSRFYGLFVVKKAIQLSGFDKEKIVDWFTSKSVIEISSCFELIKSGSLRTNLTKRVKDLQECVYLIASVKYLFRGVMKWKLYRVKD